MKTAFVLGNGRSRLAVNLTNLRSRGTIYGCNALYREFIPDVLVATDKGIAGRIQESGYALKYEFWTRKPLDRQGAHKIEQPYYGMSSGPVAVSRACIRNHKSIYLLGFDLGGNDLFNNVYADTEFYKRSTDKATYAGNWISQLQQIFKIFSKVHFYRVNGIGSMDIKFNCDNNETVSIADFDSRINKL